MKGASSIRRALRALRSDTSGMAFVEFALALPFVLGISMAGIELTFYTIAKMRMSQLALHIADNGARIGTSTDTTDPQISETNINDLLTGANLQSGSLQLFGRGRVIVSSLEPDPDNAGKYYIHWQRCKGLKNSTPGYGTAGVTSGANSGKNMTAMGPTGRQVTAPSDGGVMYVEIYYDYKPVFFTRVAPSSTIKEVAAMTIRDKRDFYGNDPDGAGSQRGTGIYNVENATAASCSTFSAT
jgi:hypothetical protein